jgi:hypothetical protein
MAGRSYGEGGKRGYLGGLLGPIKSRVYTFNHTKTCEQAWQILDHRGI